MRLRADRDATPWIPHDLLGRVRGAYRADRVDSDRTHADTKRRFRAETYEELLARAVRRGPSWTRSTTVSISRGAAAKRRRVASNR